MIDHSWEVYVHGLQFVGNWLVALSAIAAWLFVWMYRRLDWRANAIGKFLMHFILLIAIVLTWATVQNFFDLEDFWRQLIRVVIFLAILIYLAILNNILVYYEKKAKRVKATEEEEQFYG